MSETNAAVRYELLYIIPTTFTEEEAGTIEQKVAALIAKYGGTLEDAKRLGKLKFAYEVKNQRHGFYVLVHFTADRASLAKIDENLRITPEVLRHIVLRAEEAGDDGKYELIEFREVNLDNKEDKPRRRLADKPEASKEDAPKDETAKEEPKEALKEEASGV
ncbi:30S ribosomal protein S6 [Candidatus Uhrbacteria bacterium]|nr:30S ribosomal protein S6 [Candidatus Uhrbacteria bacterium]